MTRPRSLTLLTRILAVTSLSLALAIGGVGPARASDLVDVPDAKLAACLHTALGTAGLPDEFTAANLASLTKLGCSSIANLTGAEYLTGLLEVGLDLSQTTDLSPLAHAPHLWKVRLSAPQTPDISPFAALPSLTYLNLSSTPFSDLRPLARFTGLTTLVLQHNAITDLSPLSGLVGLQTLGLDGNPISSLAPLSSLTALTKLTLSNTGLSDLGPLRPLTNLTHLSAGGNKLGDLSALSGMGKLQTLFLSANKVSDLTPLSGATSLVTLTIPANQVSDLRPLAGMTELVSLWISNNHVADLSPLSGMTKLRQLFMEHNQVVDLSPLGNATALTTLQMGSNPVQDLSPLAGTTALSDLDAYDCQIETIGAKGTLQHLKKVNLTSNHIRSIAGLAGAPLTEANLSDNQISDLSPLAGMPLTTLYLSSNAISDVSPLKDLPASTTVSLSNNQIRDLSPLPDDLDPYAFGQSVSYPGEASVGVPVDLGLRDIDGSPVCSSSLLDGISCTGALATFQYPGTYQAYVGSSRSRYSAHWTQKVVGTGHFTSPSGLTLAGWPYVGGGMYVVGNDGYLDDDWAPGAASLTYQWYADGRLISDTSKTHGVTKAELGKRIKGCITAHRTDFADDQVCTAESAPIAIWQTEPTTTWIKSSAPKLTGKVRAGSKLSIKLAGWDSGVHFRYRWQRNGKDIKGATHATYRLTRKDLRKNIRVKVWGSKPGYRTVVRYSNIVRPKR